jgi:hypothetical protein
VEAAEAAVTGEQERQQAAMRNMQAQLQMENLQEQRAARAERIARQKKADEAADLARITQPGVEEIREEAPLETTVPSTVPGLPGQQISVPKPQKQYRAEFEQGGKRYGVRSSEEMAQEQARITQAAYPVITKKMAADLGQPELEGQRVPPNEFNEFVKMAQPVAPKSTDIDYQDYRDEVSGTVTRIGFDKKTGAEVSRQVLKGIERKRPPASSSAVAPGGMSNEEFKRSRGLQSDFDRSPILKIYPDIRSALDSMKSAAQQGDSVGDIALMRYFAKLTDPSTGVREEEYRALQGAQGALEKLKLWTSGEWLEGQKLTPALRQAFIRMADKVHENRVKQINSLMTTYRGRAKAAGVDPETIFGDWPTLIGGPGAPTAGAGKKDSLGIR